MAVVRIEFNDDLYPEDLTEEKRKRIEEFYEKYKEINQEFDNNLVKISETESTCEFFDGLIPGGYSTRDIHANKVTKAMLQFFSSDVEDSCSFGFGQTCFAESFYSDFFDLMEYCVGDTGMESCTVTVEGQPGYYSCYPVLEKNGVKWDEDFYEDDDEDSGY